MSETTTQESKRTPTVYTEVTMTDGRVVKFAGKRKVDKTLLVDVEAKTAGVRFDFVNGQTRTVRADEFGLETQLTALAHGISQKVGDDFAGETDIDDIVLSADKMIERLRKEGWTAPREAGDSMAGASIVIRALCEATQKDQEWIKNFLDKKLEAAKAAGQKLSRQDLYQSFRNPNSKTGQIIKRLEDEKRAKATKVDADAELAAMLNETGG